MLDAAVRQEIIGGSTSSLITGNDYDSVCRKTNEAVRAMLAAQQPHDPVKELREAWLMITEFPEKCKNYKEKVARMEAAIAALEAQS